MITPMQRAGSLIQGFSSSSSAMHFLQFPDSSTPYLTMTMSLHVLVAVYGFVLGAGAESAILATVNASCTNRFRGKARARFGFNDGLWNGGPTFADPRYAHVLQESGGLLLRYPGGSCASYWNWTTGSFC